MGENLKIPFFKRIKRAIVNFEIYGDLAVEKMSISIKYYAKLMIIFSIIVSIVFSYKFSTIINNEEEMQIIYNQLAETGIDVKLIEEPINYIKANNNFQFYATLTLVMFISVYCAYFLLGLTDIILISILGLIISRITRIIIKYRAIFIMSIYSLTLPIILNCIYIAVNTLTGFTIEYFSMVYNIIAYIYIITAILMIKTFFIEHRQELIQIINEQRKVKKEEREDQEDKGEEENKNKDDNKGENEEPEDGENPIQTP